MKIAIVDSGVHAGHPHVGAVAGGVVLVFIALMAIAGPALAPYDPLRQQPAQSLQRPNPEHPFGTDVVGRDVLSRVIWGSRVSLGVGFSSVVITIVIGTAIGLAAGYSGGWTDGAHRLGTSPEKDVGFPYRSSLVPRRNAELDERMTRYSWQSYLNATASFARCALISASG